MTEFSASEIHQKAIRDFLASLGILSVFFGAIPLYVFWTSPAVPEFLRSGLVGTVAVSWVVGAFGIVQVLRRDLTPVLLQERGMQAGRKFIPYIDIVEIDSQPGRRVFRLSQRGRRVSLYLSKIGVADENRFFEDLKHRIAVAGQSVPENSHRSNGQSA